MMRSEINKLINGAVDFFKDNKFYLPPFAFYDIEDWRRNKNAVQEIFDLGLGWDVTDFGGNEFDKSGLLLFTLRNGKLNSDVYLKTYAEKIMMVNEEQVTPMHFHWYKREDIINRGGGNLVIELYNSAADGKFSGDKIVVSINGTHTELPAGSNVVLKPGESICLTPMLYHRFYGEKDQGAILVGEVSMVNDDTADNRFYETTGRFADIIEDVSPEFLLCNEYHKYI